MSKRGKARAAVEREHALASAPVAPRSWLYWVGIAVGATALFTLLGLVHLDDILEGKALLVAQALSFLVTISVFYWVTLGAARSALSRRPFGETLSWLKTEPALNGWGVASLTTLALYVVSGLLGAFTSTTGPSAVLIISNIIGVTIALTLAYREHFLTFTLSPAERERYAAKVQQEREGRLARLRAFFKPLPRRADGRQKMGTPLLQAALVTYLPTVLWSLILASTTQGQAPQWAYDVLVLPLMVVAIRVWASWNRAGGVLSILRISRSRALETAA